MMFAMLGISLALALLFTLNTLIALVVSTGWRICAPLVETWSGQQRARALFLLRLLPGLAALCGVALLVPAYFINEPREAAETVSLKLAILAGLSFAGLVLAVWRGLAAWWTTRCLVSNWMNHAEPVDLAGVSIPAFRLFHPFPVLAVVGLWRPRLFIAEQLLCSLTPDELQAALKHEMGHLFAYDNFKRTALRACRDVLMLVPTGRALDAAWDEAAEEAADEFAVSQEPATAISLAAALVKIARLAPVGLRAALPIHASYLAALALPENNLARRVRRLLNLADAPPVTAATSGTLGYRFATLVILTALMLGVLTLALNPLWLATLHEFNELIVYSLR